MEIKRIIEATLFAATKPLTISQLQGIFSDVERPAKAAIHEALVKIANEYRDRPIELKQVASGYRFQVRKEFSPWVIRLFQERPVKYSRAFLETLSIIVYRQPMTRAEIEAIRGVGVSSSIVRTLLDREWVRIVGHKEVPGRPALYATTKQFLDSFDLQSLNELPPLKEISDLKLPPDLMRPELDTQEADLDTGKLSTDSVSQ